MSAPNEADRTAAGMPTEQPPDEAGPAARPGRDVSPEETLDPSLTPAPPIPGVSETVAPHPLLEPGPIGPTPLGPEGDRRPDDLR